MALNFQKLAIIYRLQENKSQMLHIRNASQFRNYYKTVVAKDRDTDLDVDFVNTLHPDKGERFEKGFARLIYANRKDIGGFLRSSALNVAADQQALYELIQNADDSNSTFFSVSYNEDYLLCINNGNYFTDSNMSAIINVGDSDKHGEDIGTFGIGFKILHRLLGEDDGLDAIINDYAGPIIFSWNKFSQLEKLLNGDDIKTGGFDREINAYSYELDKSNPWLVKIIYTCFPTHLYENIRLRDYETQKVAFKSSDLYEMRSFLRQLVQQTKLVENEKQNLNKGSIFFLKLGKDKHKFIYKNIDSLKSGIAYSFNFLNSLKKIYINGEEIQKQPLSIPFGEVYKIGSPEFEKIKPRNIERDIKYKFAFYENYKHSDNLENKPNFYNFFSMDEEKNGFRFLVQCNAFDMHNDRRKLQPDSQINERLLPIIVQNIIENIDNQRDKNRTLYLSLYASLLLSTEPKNKANINEFFFSFIEQYLPRHIPTQSQYSDRSSNVKIKDTKCDIQPADFGCPEIEWFYWQTKEDDELVENAILKLSLDKWDVTHIIEKAEIDELNTWIEKTTDENYQLFLKELGAESALREQTITKLQKLKFLHFSDNRFHSIEDVATSDNLLICFDKVLNIRSILVDLGFSVSSLNISSYKELYAKLKDSLESDVRVYEKIASLSAQNAKRLQPQQKRQLFENFISETTKFDKVGKETLKELVLFGNNLGELLPIEKLLSPKLALATWLQLYQIDETEYFSALESYLMPKSAIYQEIIYPEESFKTILNHVEIEQVEQFYKQITEYYSLTDNAKGFVRHPFIFTGIEFVHTHKIFYSVKLKDIKNYADFQAVIQKISQKQLPKKTLLPHFDDGKTPFYIKVGEDITDLPLEGSYTQAEVSEILNFCTLNKESFFKTYWIGQENDDCYKIYKGATVQFYTSNQDLANVLSEKDIFKPLPKSLHTPELNTIGLHTETESLLKQAIMTGVFDSRLMRLLKKSDSADLKKEAISQIKRLDIQSGTEYGDSTFEHLAVEIFIDQYKEDEKQIDLFRDKIFINGINVKEFSFSNQVIFRVGESDDAKKYEFSLSTILPDYEGSSDLVSSIIEQFKDKDLRKYLRLIFKTERKQPARVYDELRKVYPKIVNPKQGAFLMIHANLRNDSTVLNGFDFSAVQASEILNSLFEIGFGNILKQSILPDFEVRKWIHPNRYAYGPEVIPDWVSDWLENGKKDLKLAYLEVMGLRSENSELVQLRKALIGESDIDTEGLLANLKTDTGTLTNTLLWFADRISIIQKATKQVGILKNLYSKLPYDAQLPIPIVKNFENSEIELLINDNYLFYFGEVDSLFFEKIFDVLTQKSHFYLSDILSEAWLKSLNPTKISLEEAVNIEKLRISEKWEMPHLKRWEEIHDKSVFLYDGQIPYQTKFLGEIISEFESGDVYSVENQIFINKVADCETLFLAALNSEEQASYFKVFHAQKPEAQAGIHFAEEQKAFQKFVEGRSIEEVKELILLGLMVKNYSKPEEAEDRSNNTVFRTEINSGLKAEIIVNEYLIESFGKERVRWVSEKNTGAKYGTKYDFEVLMQDLQNVMYYIDAKSTTTSNESEEIDIIFRNSEWKFMISSEKDKYLIAKVFNANNPTFDDIVFLKMRIEEL